jgi:hypothetical protein
MDNVYIKCFSKIKNGSVHTSNGILFSDETRDATSFLKQLYQFIKMDYPKFYKMDVQSQMGILLAELVYQQLPKDKSYNGSSTGIVLSNAAGSEDTDKKFFATISDKENFFPSPSLFVYTLPSIVSGEICIRHQIKGEHNFFISENFDAEELCQHISHLYKFSSTQSCIGGWINYTEETLDGFLFMSAKEKSNSKEELLTPKKVNELYLN